MPVKCPDVSLVLVAMRIIMGKFSGLRSHSPKYFTLILSNTVNTSSLEYPKTYRLCITWRVWAVWLLAGRVCCAWDGIRRKFPGCGMREAQLAARAENKGYRLLQSAGEMMDRHHLGEVCTLLLVHLAPSGFKLGASVFPLPQPNIFNILIFCAPFFFPSVFAHSSNESLLSIWLFM